MRRFFPVVIVVVAALTSLSSCYLGPAPVQYAALAVTDGRPTAVVAVCGRPTVEVEVYLDDNNANDGKMYLWSVTVTLPSQVQDIDVELFGASRPGWEITPKDEETIGSGDNTVTMVPLRSIEAGQHYRLDSSKSGPEGTSAADVTFTTDDLTRIGAGQVLTAGERTEVVTRDSFVKDRCG